MGVAKTIGAFLWSIWILSQDQMISIDSMQQFVTAIKDLPPMEFRRFTQESFQATDEQWRRLADEAQAFTPDTEQILKWTAEHIEIKDNAVAYGVFPPESTAACGICELIVTKKSPKNGWVKFIQLKLDPKIDAQIFANDPNGIVVAIEAYISCVIGVLDVKDHHDASTVKVFGRTQEQMQFLTLLSAALQKRDAFKFTTSIEGRWLVLNWSTK